MTETPASPKQREYRAFLVYECREGWCIEPADAEQYIHRKPQRMWAFSRLSQLTWWLQKAVKK